MVEVEEVEIEKNETSKLYCTHCGYTFIKPKIPVNYIIKCEKCNRPLHLHEKYYVKYTK